MLPSACTLLLPLGQVVLIFLQMAALLPFSRDVSQALALPGPTLSPGALTAQFASPVLVDYTKTGQHAGQDTDTGF